MSLGEDFVNQAYNRIIRNWREKRDKECEDTFRQHVASSIKQLMLGYTHQCPSCGFHTWVWGPCMHCHADFNTKEVEKCDNPRHGEGCECLTLKE